MVATLVVGGSGGIGSAIVRRFAAEGEDVLFTYLRARETAEDVLRCCATSSGRVIAEPLDVRDQDQLADVVDACGGDLSTVLFVAASGTSRSMATARAKHWDWTFEVNARAFGLLYNLVLEQLSEKKGSLLALSSPGARLVLPDYGLVGASKASLEAIVRYAAVEAGPMGVRVNAICPGVVETKALDNFPERGKRLLDLVHRTPLGRFVTPDEVAAIAWWLHGADAALITGQVLTVDGGWSLNGPLD
jgi:enoyl-[acyl-carrier protein] reductase III